VATVWKLQGEPHVDTRDCELSVVTCGGNFTKGHMYLPDLGLCLRWGSLIGLASPGLKVILHSYEPGDIIILRSPYIYHAVGKWEPGPYVAGQRCTPGRVSWVHFTHEEVAKKLAGKRKNWLIESSLA